MQNKIRFGIIGAGKIAHKFCKAAELSGEAEVVAVASNTPGKAKAFAESERLSAWHDGYDELLTRSDVDAVYIATTHNFHHANMLAALNAGKHILCEKAFTLTRREAEEVFALAGKKGLFCMEAMWSRFLPTIQKAREWVLSGRLGPLETAYFSIGFKADADPMGRMRNPDLAGGAMFDIGVYAIELTTYLIPEQPREVRSVISRLENGVDSVDNILLRFEHCVASLQCCMTAKLRERLEIYGQNGSICIPSCHHSDTAELYGEAGELVESFTFPFENGFEYQIREAAFCIRQGKLESDIVPHCDTLACAGIFDECLDGVNK